MVRGNEYTQILTSTPEVDKFTGLAMLHSFDRIKIRRFHSGKTRFDSIPICFETLDYSAVINQI